MEAVADLAERYSFGEIRVTHEQNLVLPHVKLIDDLHGLWQGLRAADLGDGQHRIDFRHHRLPWARLLQPGQRPLDPGGPAHCHERFADIERQHEPSAS